MDSHDEDHSILVKILNENYVVTEVTDNSQILDLIGRDADIAAILADYAIMRSDDFSLAKMIRQNNQYDRIPVITVSRDTSDDLGNNLSRYEIAECICAPFDSGLIKIRIKNVIKLYQYQNTMKKQHRLLKLQSDRLMKNNETIIDALGDIVEYRNVESGEHIRRVKEYTKILATEAMKSFPEFDSLLRESRSSLQQARFMILARLPCPIRS